MSSKPRGRRSNEVFRQIEEKRSSSIKMKMISITQELRINFLKSKIKLKRSRKTCLTLINSNKTYCQKTRKSKILKFSLILRMKIQLKSKRLLLKLLKKNQKKKMIIIKKEEKEIGKDKLKNLIVVAKKKKSKKSKSPFFSMKN